LIFLIQKHNKNDPITPTAIPEKRKIADTEDCQNTNKIAVVKMRGTFI